MHHHLGESRVTNLSTRKTRLSVLTSDCVRERGKLREVTFEFSPYVIKVRLKGMRQAFEISPASIYNLAVAKYVAAQRELKKKAKKGKS